MAPEQLEKDTKSRFSHLNSRSASDILHFGTHLSRFLSPSIARTLALTKTATLPRPTKTAEDDTQTVEGGYKQPILSIQQPKHS